jgi:hypothetical protein
MRWEEPRVYRIEPCTSGLCVHRMPLGQLIGFTFNIVVLAVIHKLKIANFGSKWVGHLAYEVLTRFGDR